MVIVKEDIIQICKQYLSTYEETIKNLRYEPKGIFNSEMLLFISITKKLDVKLIIESGRARGQSTKIIAENFREKNYKVCSIEFVKFSPDVKTSLRRLKKYENLSLSFGNSFDVIPNLINKECCVLIDGPKTGAIQLGINSLTNPLVKAVFIHDLHKDSKQRIIAEKVFNNHFFTDDKDFVKQFKSIDKQCWVDQSKYKEFRNWAPYRKGNKIMKSYSSTLLIVQNSKNPVNSNYLKFISNIKNEIKIRKRFKERFKNLNVKIERILRFPFNYFFYMKHYNTKNSIKIKDFIFQFYYLIKITLNRLIFD